MPNLTVQDVARRAGLAAGTLYTRFPSKDALLRTFTLAFFQRARKAADALTGDTRWTGLPPRPLVGTIARVLVKSYRAKQPLLRALHLYVRSHPDAEFRAEVARSNDEVLSRLAALVLRHRRGIRRADAEQAVTLGLLILDAAAREIVLFGDGHRAAPAVTDDELAAGLADAYCALLDFAEGTA